MLKPTQKTLWALFIILFTFQVQAKDYRNKVVGDYSHASIDLSAQRGNVTFLEFMKSNFYPVIKHEATRQTPWFPGFDHLDEIRKGVGAELKLAPNVTTYHVSYMGPGEEKAEQSGRSFGVVNKGPILAGEKVDYIADASYSFYLGELEDVLQDAEQARLFYVTIFKFLVNTDASGFSQTEMKEKTKRVAADFVAVYVAEQYRRLLHYDGRKLTSWRAWDNAHLQVTMLANFHAGQSQGIRGMFFAGEYMTQPFVQKDSAKEICAYYLLSNDLADDDETARGAFQRPFQLKDYWQFGTECGGRSGVNITRKDFTKMGRKITEILQNQGFGETLDALYTTSNRNITTRYNVIASIADTLGDDQAPVSYEESEALVQSMVDAIMLMRDKADLITNQLMH